ncbi:MAG: ribosome maturation factor RimM [Sphingomicrobium sp.]
MAPAASNERIALAAVAGAQGLKGAVRLKLFSDSAASLASHEWVSVGGVRLRLLGVKAQGKGTIARFEGVDDRTAAEALRGSLIEVERDQLPQLDDGEYYHSDLIGLPCVDDEGTPVGTVVAVENYGAGDLLDVESEGGKRQLIPFRPGIADLVSDTGGDRIVLDPEFLA